MRRGGTTSWFVLLVVVIGVVAWAWWDLSNNQGSDASRPPTPTVSASPNPSASPKPSAPGGGGSPSVSASDWPTIPADAQAFTVAHVHDGDTVFLNSKGGEQVAVRDRIKVRLIGIDTPEVTEPVQCYGREATNELRDLLPEGSTVYGVIDTEPQDHYERWLLYLWTEDGYFVNAGMVDNGFAEAIRVRPNDQHWNLLRNLEAAAERDRVGMWGSC